MNNESIVYKPLEVKVHDQSYESFQRAMKVFRAMVQKEKVLSYYKEASVYEKPSDMRRRKINESNQKRLEELREQGIVVEGTQKKKKKPKKRKEVKEIKDDSELF
jgi:ribosomal protein S21